MDNLEQTIKQCQSGNALAWEALIKAYQGRVYGVAFYMLKDKSEAEDATQEAFIKVYRGMPGFRSDEQSFLPWLLTISRNCCLDKLRKTKSRRNYESDSDVDADLIAAELSNPDGDSLEQQRKDLMYQAIEKFDQTSKDVLMMKDIQGLKTDEVAEVLSLPTGTVKSRSNRAKLKLAKVLSGFSQFKPKSSGIL